MTEEQARAYAEWKTRLEKYFSHNGQVAGFLLPTVERMERAVSLELSKYSAHRLLIDTFLDFFAFTLSEAANEIRTKGWPEDAEHYNFVLAMYQTIFLAFRSAEMVFGGGYPLDGYALQRNISESVILLGGIANGLTSYLALSGFDQTQKDQTPSSLDMNKVRVKRVNEERRVWGLMVGSQSGLPTRDIAELKSWNDLFDLQVHGSRISMYGDSGSWLTHKGEVFTIGPVFNERSASVFMNIEHHCAWMAHRLLPFLQHPSTPFSESWSEQWQVMDDSLRFMVKASEEIGPIAGVITRLVEGKFAFSPTTKYVER